MLINIWLEKGMNSISERYTYDENRAKGVVFRDM